jgi:phosphate transport system ATP-binding protein
MAFQLTFPGKRWDFRKPTTVSRPLAESGGLPVHGDRLATTSGVESGPKIHCGTLNVYFGAVRAIRDLNLDIGASEVLALMGPRGAGKTTLLRCLNRMNDFITSCVVTGDVCFAGEDVNRGNVDEFRLRARVGMVFPEPKLFRRTIFENIAYGIRLHGLAAYRAEEWELVEASLRRVGLWGQVKHQLDRPADSLSRFQQQCLCIARALAVQPEVILMDEPCTELDPVDGSRIDALINALHEHYTIVVATSSAQQAARVAQRTAFLFGGELIEVANTAQLFVNPRHRLTSAFLRGTVG